MAAFMKEIEKHFGFLRSAGYEVLTHEAGPMSSGLALFRSARVSIQVVQDRGDWFFEAGALGNVRYADHLLVEALPDARPASARAVNHRDPAAVAEQLRQMLPAIEDAFSSHRATPTIDALRRLGQT